MADTRAKHWDLVYADREPTEVSWYQAVPQTSLDMIGASGVAPTKPLIDVGGGASRLVDCLLNRGYRDVTVLDIAASALQRTRRRLGAAAHEVHWRVGNVLDLPPDRRYALWHDRAAFHFLTRSADRTRYVERLKDSLRNDGYVVLATFGPEGPVRCSGLPTCRYDVDRLGRQLGSAFRLEMDRVELHRTPGGATQQFLYTLWRLGGQKKRPAGGGGPLSTI